MGRTPPSVFWGKRIPTKGQFLSKILYRQVHWCAALFCRTSPEQAKIPQNRPNFRVFDIFGQKPGRRNPPPPILGCRPKFQPPQSEGAGRGLVPLGDQETGEQTFCCPHPPQQKWGRTESRPSTPPPPACPHTLTAGRHMVIEVPQGADAERQVCWDLGPAW